MSVVLVIMYENKIFSLVNPTFQMKKFTSSTSFVLLTIILFISTVVISVYGSHPTQAMSKSF